MEVKVCTALGDINKSQEVDTEDSLRMRLKSEQTS